MKKTLFTIALLAVMLLSTSGYKPAEANVKCGDLAPEIQVSNAALSTALSQMQGKYVLLSFWSSSDAKSRIECNNYSTWARNCQLENVRHISINFDQEVIIFNEIVRRDNFDENAQFNVSGSIAERIMRDYGLSEGMGTILIGPDGRIIGFNPTTHELSSLS